MTRDGGGQLSLYRVQTTTDGLFRWELRWERKWTAEDVKRGGPPPLAVLETEITDEREAFAALVGKLML